MYTVLDLETGSKEVFLRKGNPWFNSIVAVGLKTQDKINAYMSKGKSYVDFNNIVVGFNFKFDLLHLWKSNHLQIWLQNGGRIFDCQLAEYYINSFHELYPALRETAVKYGCEAREKFMEAYWDAGLDTSEIPEELILLDVTNDILDTEKVYLKQVEELKKLGTSKLLEIHNDCLLALTEIEYNGMYLDKEQLISEKNSLVVQIENKTRCLLDLVSRYYPSHLVLQFNFAGNDLKKLLFGGVIEEKKKEVLVDAEGFPVLIKSGDNKGSIKYKNNVYKHSLQQLVVPTEIMQTEKGNISLDDPAITEIINTTSNLYVKTICELVLDLRGCKKQLSTYFLPMLENQYEDGCIRGNYNLCGTVTGRSSADKPNTQNLPGIDKSNLKYCFTSRYE